MKNVAVICPGSNGSRKFVGVKKKIKVSVTIGLSWSVLLQF